MRFIINGKKTKLDLKDVTGHGRCVYGTLSTAISDLESKGMSHVKNALYCSTETVDDTLIVYYLKNFKDYDSLDLLQIAKQLRDLNYKTKGEF